MFKQEKTLWAAMENNPEYLNMKELWKKWRRKIWNSRPNGSKLSVILAGLWGVPF